MEPLKIAVPSENGLGFFLLFSKSGDDFVNGVWAHSHEARFDELGVADVGGDFHVALLDLVKLFVVGVEHVDGIGVWAFVQVLVWVFGIFDDFLIINIRLEWGFFMLNFFHDIIILILNTIIFNDTTIIFS